MGKFGGDNVWQKWMDEDFGKNFWRMNGLAKMLNSVSGQLSDRTNYRIKHPIIILWKYPGLDYQKLANHFREAGRKTVARTVSCD